MIRDLLIFHDLENASQVITLYGVMSYCIFSTPLGIRSLISMQCPLMTLTIAFSKGILWVYLTLQSLFRTCTEDE
jgi:hypothetical protein